MANNKTEIVTIPLKAKLNMNENQQIITPDADMFNDVNSPIVGGTLKNLWYSAFGGNYRSLYDKHGIQWTPRHDGLYKNVGTTSPEKVLNAGSGHFFTGSFGKYNFVDLLPTDCNGTNGGVSAGFFGVEIISPNSTYANGAVKVSRYTGAFSTDGQDDTVPMGYMNKGNVGETGTAAIYTCQNSRTPVAARMFKKGNNYFLLVVTYLSAQNGYRLELCDVSRNTGAPIAVTYKVSQDLYFHGNQASGSRFYGVADNSASTGSLQVGAAPQIVISKQFNASGFDPSGGSTIGVTVYLNKMQAQNCHKHLWYANFLIGFNSSDVATVFSKCYLQPAVSSFGNLRYKYDTASGKAVVDGGPSNKTISSQLWGAFCDDSTWIYMTGSWHDERDARNSSDNDWCGMGGDLATGNSFNYNNTVSAYVGVLTASAVAINDDRAIECVNDGDSDKLGRMKFLIWSTLTTNQRYHRLVLGGPGKWKGSSKDISGAFYMIENQTNRPLRLPGVQSTMTIPTTDDAWAKTDSDSGSLWVQRDNIDDGIYNSQGARINIDGTNFYALYNYKQGFVSGISWAPDNNTIGTLITEWDTIDDSVFIHAVNNGVFWRDCKTGEIRWCCVVNDTYSELDKPCHSMRIVADRYVLYNTTEYYNCVDIETGKKGHFASDWNDRIIYGIQTLRSSVNGASIENYENAQSEVAVGGYYVNATVASGVDVAYQKQKTFSPSRLLAYNAYQKIYGKSAYIIGGTNPEGKLDLFRSSGSTAPLYAGSTSGGTTTGAMQVPTWDGMLDGTTYPVTSSGSALYNIPMVGTKFINSFSGKFGVVMGDTGYSIQYDGVRPIAIYNSTSMVDDIETFFIIQSQFYAVINDYICAVSYSTNNILNGIEQIVNVNGMKFIGAFPSVAYFYSPSAKSIFAFTGDADLQLFVQTDKISNINAWMYAPNNEWIYLSTNNGVYVLTQQNVFRMDETIDTFWKGFNTDKDYNILEQNSGLAYKVGLSDQLDYPFTVRVDTAYFGPGDMRNDVIDTFYLRIYQGDRSNNQGTVDISATALVDNKLVETEKMHVVLNAAMWDSDKNYLIRYQPNFPECQGLAFHIKSTYPIAYMGYSHKKDSTVQTTIQSPDRIEFEDRI